MHPIASITGWKSRQPEAFSDADHLTRYRAPFHSVRRVGLNTPDFPIVGTYAKGDMWVLPHDFDDFPLYLGVLARVKDVAEGMVSVY